MKRNSLLIILLFSLGISCSQRNKDRIKSNIEIPVYVANEEFIKEIIYYHDKYLADNPTDEIISILYSQQKDTSIFLLSIEMNLMAVLDNPPTFHCKINEFDVIVRSELTSYFIYSGDYLETLGENLFPSQYAEYKSKGEFILPITYSCEKWKLKFIDGKLLSKEM